MGKFKNWVENDVIQMIRKWNDEESNFRTKTRLENNKFKTWQVKKIRQRKLIINGLNLTYKLGVYLDTQTGKSFTYYHNEEVKGIGKNQYYYKDIYNQFKKQIWARRKKNNQKLIPKYVLDYHLKIGNLSYDFHQNYEKFDKENMIEIHIDDTYFKENLGHKKIKRCIRNVFLIDKNNQKYSLIFKENYKNLNFICNKIKLFLGMDFDKNKVIISGDGARFINTISEKLGVKRYYDLYHFKRNLFNIFGFNKTKNKKNLEFPKYFQVKNLYKILNNFLEKMDFVEFKRILKSIINHLKIHKIFLEKLKELRGFLKNFSENEEYIFNTFLRKNYGGGRAETYINHFIKTPIFKRFSLFSWKNCKNFIRLKNQDFYFEFF